MQFQYANCVKPRRSRPSEAMVRHLYGFATIQAKDYSPTCERRVAVRLAESPLLESLVAWLGISTAPSPPSKRRFSAPPVKSISSIAASTADGVRALPCEDSI